ncbi:hypothetical protein G3574_26185 [Noviherbaspirillum sp. 17J57-3]|uniref:Type 4 fimbrial biogenesis protein PilX N-terminal domain-containing protein n=2 Tax=Noviherbaspirillum galbum TaxID=2709383 RepID=A0A6B3SVC8_9BURK|nr:hypothetical protein [Noviherbaspirillum galbum]
MATIVMFLVTIVTLYANKGGAFEQKMSGNHYMATQAFKAAQAGIDYSIAWLSTAGNPNGAAWKIPAGTTGAVWVSDNSYSPYNQKNTSSIAGQTIGNYAVNVTLWRNASRPTVIEIVSSANGDASSTIRQIVNVLTLSFDVPTVAPLVVNGSISGVTGNPDITGADAAGNAVVSSAAPGNIDMGHMNYTGNVVANGFTGTAWDYLFGISKSDMATIANYQSGGPTAGPIYYYDDTTVSNYQPASIGTSSNPVILVFDITSGSCPKINGGKTIYGIVYCGQGFDMQGWGGTTIYGSLVIDTNLTKFTANTNLGSNTNANNPSSYSATPIVTRIIGSWRDF